MRSGNLADCGVAVSGRWNETARSYPPFLKHVQDYYDVLLKKIVPYQINYGGPVILMQVENEYGYYANDREYLLAMRDKMQKGGVVVPLVTSDGRLKKT